jgi:hypothetical protein
MTLDETGTYVFTFDKFFRRNLVLLKTINGKGGDAIFLEVGLRNK